MAEQKAANIIRDYIGKMPSLPTTVGKILEIANDPKASPADLNKVINLDPVLMGKVLKLINSAYYSLPNKITSLARAIIMLGINTVKNLALSTAVLGNVGSATGKQALDLNGFWRHSIGVGITAKMIAQRRKIDQKSLEEYFIAGLLHDIGKVPLNNRLPDEYLAALASADSSRVTLWQAEQSTIGISHVDVGLLVADNWSLGQNVRAAVEFHHQPAEYTGTSKDIVWTVAAANYLVVAAEIGFSGDRYPVQLAEQVFQYLMIDLDFLDEIEEEVGKRIEQAQIFLKIAQ
jgi:putative nucleotidyltransferase with HDIG domain